MFRGEFRDRPYAPLLRLRQNKEALECSHNRSFRQGCPDLSKYCIATGCIVTCCCSLWSPITSLFEFFLLVFFFIPAKMSLVYELIFFVNIERSLYSLRRCFRSLLSNDVSRSSADSLSSCDNFPDPNIEQETHASLTKTMSPFRSFRQLL